VGFWRQRLRRHPTRVLVGGFAAAILVGALLLTLPVSSVDARIGLLDALFTAPLDARRGCYSKWSRPWAP
jgi:hypothetical protein